MRFTCYLASFLLLCLPAWAQTATGKISGRVEDSSGAMIPNARLCIIALLVIGLIELAKHI